MEQEVMELLREKVVLDNPHISNAIDEANKVEDKEFAEYCEKFIDHRTYEIYQNMPEPADYADLQISSDEVNS